MCISSLSPAKELRIIRLSYIYIYIYIFIYMYISFSLFPAKNPLLPCKRAAHSHTRASALRWRRHCGQVWMRLPCKRDVYYFSKEIYITSQQRYILLLKRDLYYFSKEIYITSQKRCSLLVRRDICRFSPPLRCRKGAEKH